MVINEIAWMGTKASQYGEWVELYNAGTGTANLSDWALYEGDTKILGLFGAIAPGAYYLIERTTTTSPLLQLAQQTVRGTRHVLKSLRRAHAEALAAGQLEAWPSAPAVGAG